MADTDSRSGATYSSPAILDYLDHLHAPHTPAMLEALETIEVHDLPPIQISPTEGKILAVLARLVNAGKVVEIGTLSGYSALWLLEGMKENGTLWTVEYNARHADIARNVFRKAGCSDRVTLLEGSALDRLTDLEAHAPFDLVFIDGDKERYDVYVRWALNHVRPGGLVIADNAYLFGYLQGREPDEKWNLEAIEAMRRAHETLARESESVCLPTPDGLVLGMKR